MEQLNKIHKVSENLTLFGNVANAIDANFDKLKENIEITESKIPKSIEVIPGIENYMTEVLVLNAIANIYTNGTISLDAFATKRELQNTSLSLSSRIESNTQEINNLKALDKKFTTALPDNTNVVFPVGNIGADITVEDLKQMTIGQILEKMLFKETWPDSQSDYNFYCDIKVPSKYVRYNSTLWNITGEHIEPDQRNTPAVKSSSEVKFKTNASTITLSTSTQENSSDWNKDIYTVNCMFEPKIVISTSNFGNLREYSWESGKTESYSAVIPRIYPIFVSSEELYMENDCEIQYTLSSPIKIAVPFKGSLCPSISIQLNTLGWLDANMETWDKTKTNNYKGISHNYIILEYKGNIQNTPFKFNIKWQ